MKKRGKGKRRKRTQQELCHEKCRSENQSTACKRGWRYVKLRRGDEREAKSEKIKWRTHRIRIWWGYLLSFFHFLPINLPLLVSQPYPGHLITCITFQTKLQRNCASVKVLRAHWHVCLFLYFTNTDKRHTCSLVQISMNSCAQRLEQTATFLHFRGDRGAEGARHKGRVWVKEGINKKKV